MAKTYNVKIDQVVFTKSVDKPVGELMVDAGDWLESNLGKPHTHDPEQCKACQKALEKTETEQSTASLGPAHEHNPQFCDDCSAAREEIDDLAGDWDNAFAELQQVARRIRAATGVDGNDWTEPED